MQIIRTKEELRAVASALKLQGKKIGFAPTMGALHAGHLSLIDIAKAKSDIVVVSIFVNPAQFAPHEDFDKYPRTEQSDLERLKAASVDIAYLPTRSEIYSENHALKIAVGAIGQELEGIARPHFFDGVALVVNKLFMQVQPDVAVFGEKDFQQLVIIKKLVQDFDIPVEVIGAPIMREEDGLAMSSRNIYLSADKRAVAANLYKTLLAVKERLLSDKGVAEALAWGREELIKSGFEAVDYLELRSAKDLSNLTNIQEPARLLAVARLCGVRLLDNISI